MCDMFVCYRMSTAVGWWLSLWLFSKVVHGIRDATNSSTILTKVHGTSIPKIDWLCLKENEVGNQHSILPHTKYETDEQVGSYPGSRSGAGWWTDHINGQVWMYGGKGYDGHPTEEDQVLGDMWMFSTKGMINNFQSFNHHKVPWRCVSRGEPTSLSPVIPPQGHLAAVCGVHSIAIIVFGGQGKASKVLENTWVYYIEKALWLPLQFKRSEPTPEARMDPAHWCIHDKMIIYGGRDSKGKALNDMWQFSLKKLVWTKITMQTLSRNKENFPLGRSGASTWHAKNSLLYMFGGQSNTNGYLSDLWIFFLHNTTWQLIHDSLIIGRKVHYGTLGVGNKENCPGGREHSAVWLDLLGNMWLFGGENEKILSDLWKYDVMKDMWIWMGSQNSASSSKDSKSSVKSGYPSPRSKSGGWSYHGMMFLFGGLGKDARNKTAQLNDMWVVAQGNVTELFSKEKNHINIWFRHLPASTIFIVVLSTIGGIALTFGTVFYIKKMLEYPYRGSSSSEFNVRYSPLTQEATLET